MDLALNNLQRLICHMGGCMYLIAAYEHLIFVLIIFEDTFTEAENTLTINASN